MSEKSSNSAGTTIVSFLTGAVTGALAGMIFALDKESNTSEKIIEKSQIVGADANNEVNKKIDELESNISDFMEEVRGKLAELEKGISR
jgi:gas vesicle protein